MKRPTIRRKLTQEYQVTPKEKLDELFPYSCHVLSKFYDRLRLEMIKGHLPHIVYGRTILDIGCADGLFLLAIQEKGCFRLGVDVSRNLIKKARRAANKLDLGSDSEFLLCGGEDLCLRDGRVDAVICAEVLEHVSNPVKVVDESARVLKSGGFLIVSLPAVHVVKLLFSRLFAKRISYRSPTHLREYAYRKYGEVQGLDDLIFRLAQIHFGAIEIRNIGVFYILSRFVRNRTCTRALQILEWKLSKITPPLLSGIFFIVKAVKK